MKIITIIFIGLILTGCGRNYNPADVDAAQKYCEKHNSQLGIKLADTHPQQ